MVGVIHGINAFLPLLKATARTAVARVVTISSMAADLELTLSAEYHRHGAYSISKAAVNMAMAKYATRFRDENIVFLSICPGIVDTATRASMLLFSGYRSRWLMTDIQGHQKSSMSTPSLSISCKRRIRSGMGSKSLPGNRWR